MPHIVVLLPTECVGGNLYKKLRAYAVRVSLLGEHNNDALRVTLAMFVFV
jgi:hypothetical protein